MAIGVPMMYVYDYAQQRQNHPETITDQELVDFVGHDTLDNMHLARGSMLSPPPPYEPISYPLTSPSPSPSPPPHSTANPIIAVAHRDGPVPQHLHDPDFSPDPNDHPHFIMTASEQIRDARMHLDRGSHSMLQIPPSLRPSRTPFLRAHPQHARSQSNPHTTAVPPVPPKDLVSSHLLQSRPPPASVSHQRMISASSMFPVHAVWLPPAISYASSTESESSTSSHASLQQTPEASPPSSTSSSPRNSSVPTTPSASTTNLHKEDLLPPPLPVVISPTEQAPPSSRQPSQAPARSLGAKLPPTTTPHSVQPTRNQSAPELHVRPTPPPTLVRSATAPSSSTVIQNQSLSRNQSQDQIQRGRSREHHVGQAVKRQRSRRPSVTAPRDLDRIDELDETDPRGLAWHHESPYELVTRSLSHKKKDGLEMDGDGVGGAGSSWNVGRPRYGKANGGMSFSVEPGQIFPSDALYQAMQAPYKPPAPMAASYPPPFDPYNPMLPQGTYNYIPGAPSFPPSADAARPMEASSKQSDISHVPLQQSQRQQGGLSNNRAGQRSGSLPPPPAAASMNSETVRPVLPQRPSQRSHVRFESPSRPDVRPSNQGSADDAYDGIGVSEVPPVPATQTAPLVSSSPQSQSPNAQISQSTLSMRRPQPAVQGAAPSNHPQPRPGSMYDAAPKDEPSCPRPDIVLPPRHPAPTQTPLPPRHLPKQLVMPTPLQPLEEQRKAEAARLAQHHRTQAMPRERTSRSEDGHAQRPDVQTHGSRHALHHSASQRQPSVSQSVGEPALTRAASYGQSFSQSTPISGGPNVLRKRSMNNVSTQIVSSNAAAAMFAARVVDDRRQSKRVERVASGIWPRDRVKEEEIQRELTREPKVGRKLSKLTRKLR